MDPEHPTHHKVHHASNGEYLDCNYGGVLIVFDRLFGTFVDLRADIEIRYGLTTPLTTNNPLKIALHAWIDLGRDLVAARTWMERLEIVAGPPGGQVGPAQPTAMTAVAAGAEHRASSMTHEAGGASGRTVAKFSFSGPSSNHLGYRSCNIKFTHRFSKTPWPHACS